MPTRSRSCSATTTASPRSGHAARRHAAGRWARHEGSLCQGLRTAAGTPVLETVPASALFTSDGADRKPGLKGEYFNTANFNGRVYFARRSLGKMRQAAVIPKDAQPLFTRVDPKIEFDWCDGAPRAGMDDDNFGVRWTGFLAPPVSGKYWLGGNRPQRLRDLLRRQTTGRARQRPRARLRVRDGRSRGRQAVPHPRGLSRSSRTTPTSAWSGLRRTGIRRGSRQDRAPGGRRGDDPGAFAAPRRRRDEGEGGRIRRRRPRLARPSQAQEELLRRSPRSASPWCWCCSTAARWRSTGPAIMCPPSSSLVSGAGRRNGARRCPVRRLQPRRPAAGDFLQVGRPAAALRRLQHEGPHLPLFQGRAAVSLRLRLELHDLRL